MWHDQSRSTAYQLPVQHDIKIDRPRVPSLSPLPTKFTLTELQWLYERILEQPLDKRNFRKKVKSLAILEETDEIQQDVAHRAARLYRFDRKAYQSLVKEGFHFEL